ncbi:hypothetical protein EV359DRAFT_62881, partial [Lentinula novae-zelandiae]
MHLNTCVCILLGLALCLKAAPLSIKMLTVVKLMRKIKFTTLCPQKCKGELQRAISDRRRSVMKIRDQHGIVMVEIGPGPKDDPTLGPQYARSIYFDGTFKDPKGVYRKSYSVERNTKYIDNLY